MTATRPPSGRSQAISRGRLRIRIITPAVIGGPEGRGGDPISPLRPPSLRGVWRWWFRAGLGAVLYPRDDSESARDEMLENLKTIEAQIFGSTERASMLVLRPPRRLTGPEPRPLDARQGRDWSGRRYLGYGLFARNQTTMALPSDSEYEVALRLRPDPGGRDVALRDALRSTLWAWSTFGGIGARSRRGWGSVELAGADLDGTPWSRPGSEPGRADSVQGLLQAAVAGLTRLYTDFRALCEAFDVPAMVGRPLREMRTIAGVKRVVPLPGLYSDAEQALESAGVALQRYRSTLERSRNGDQPLPDYFQVKDAINRKPGAPRAVERAAFGLPLPFYFRSLGGAQARFVPKTLGFDRLASPLMIRVCPLEVGGRTRYAATFTCFSERDADPLLGQGVAMDRRPDVRIPAPDGRIISDFLDWVQRQHRGRPGGGR